MRTALVGTNGRCIRLRTSTEDGTWHLETTVVRLRKTNYLLTNQDPTFSAPSFRFLSYLHSTSSARAGQNKSPSVGVRLQYEQRTRTTCGPARALFHLIALSVQALYIIFRIYLNSQSFLGWLVLFTSVDSSQSKLPPVQPYRYRTIPFLETRSEFA